jgi:hypothetical protein
MTQDPYGQTPGTGYVRGEVIPDDEGNVVPPTAPMTRFQKVASALRGDRTDPETEDAADDADHDPASPEEVVAVRSPDAEDRDYWDEDGDEAGPAETAPAETATEPDAEAADAAAAAGTDGARRPGDADAPDTPVAGALRPGESDGALGDFSDLTFGSLLPDAAEFRTRWQQVQFRFVDDPRGSVTEAADVISQLTAKLEAAIAERQRAIADRQSALRERWSEGRDADTEALRGTLLMYRAFLDQLTAAHQQVSRPRG